jgi:hypothetical protein
MIKKIVNMIKFPFALIFLLCGGICFAVGAFLLSVAEKLF